MDGATEHYNFPPTSADTSASAEEAPVDQDPLTTGSHTYRLIDLAYARSGDKGNHCNIGEYISLISRV